jgi:hypothetical protein
MSKFWDKVEKCKHENISPDYLGGVSCDTPYCRGKETHCLDCGVFISDCGCGSNDGMSGWSWLRWLRYWRKRERSKHVSGSKA